ncbi:MAG: DUF2520 domain-containing protein [Candidatus Aminicenantes bacterium]|nr:DUF2520 domain-containing protein [Candidatus Aminicenantes bacterium]
MRKLKDFSIIGAGRVGTALAAALTAQNWNLKVIVDSVPEKARRLRKMIGQGQASAEASQAVRRSELIFLCVTDSQIEKVVRQIVKEEVQNKYFFHTSGALSSSLLAPLKEKGARVGSFHPIQTFATETPEKNLFRGIFIGLEGQPEAVRLGLKIARTLKSQVILLSPENKPAYHLACSISSNFLVVLLSEIKDIMKSIGLDEETTLNLLTPLLNKTLHNVKKLGIEASLTGPVIRGDAETVKKHLEITARFPGLDRIYRAMALEALKIAEKHGLEEYRLKALKRLLE